MSLFYLPSLKCRGLFVRVQCSCSDTKTRSRTQTDAWRAPRSRSDPTSSRPHSIIPIQTCPCARTKPRKLPKPTFELRPFQVRLDGVRGRDEPAHGQVVRLSEECLRVTLLAEIPLRRRRGESVPARRPRLRASRAPARTQSGRPRAGRGRTSDRQ